MPQREILIPKSDLGLNALAKLKKDDIKISSCDICANFAYNEEIEEYECMANMDEDEVISFYTTKNCAAFRLYDEYGTVRKQN